MLRKSLAVALIAATMCGASVSVSAADNTKAVSNIAELKVLIQEADTEAEKINIMNEQRALLLDEYNNEKNFLDKIDIAYILMDIDCSYEYKGFTTGIRYWNDGENIYDSFTGAYIK